MPLNTDTFKFDLLEEDPTYPIEGQIWFNTLSKVLRGYIDSVTVDIITNFTHKTLRQLIHFVETNSPGEGFGAGPYYCESTYQDNVFPLTEIWYETVAKAKLICKWECTYNANKTFATEKWTIYKSDGTNPAADATDTISYSGVIETSRSRAIVVY